MKTKGYKMRLTIILVASLFLITNFLYSQEDRKVLVEIFTNSHCPHCPAAHNVISNYLSGPNGDKISYIYYHMVYPYSDDSLYLESMEGSDARNNYYNPISVTPQGWFDGEHQGSSSGWAASLDNLVATESPLKIVLSGTRNTTQFNINAQLTRKGNITENDLLIHFVVVEDLFYDGRNGISNHEHVMRKMLPTPNGQSFSISLNETKDFPQTINLDPLWDADSLNIVVFVQSTETKTVYQSGTISYNELSISGLENERSVPVEFKLEQNYPNPFNPRTNIGFQVANFGFVSLKVYDVLGNEVMILVNEGKPAGTYEVRFDASGLTSGIYFYKLQTGSPSTGSGQSFTETKKMLLLK